MHRVVFYVVHLENINLLDVVCVSIFNKAACNIRCSHVDARNRVDMFCPLNFNFSYVNDKLLVPDFIPGKNSLL